MRAMAGVLCGVVLLGAFGTAQGDTTYYINDFTVGDNSIVAGSTIVTDGTVGYLDPANIVSANVGVTNGVGTVYLDKDDLLACQVVMVSATDIYLPIPSTDEEFELYFVQGDEGNCDGARWHFDAMGGTLTCQRGLEYDGDWHVATPPTYEPLVIATTVPEPATMMLLGLGGLALLRRKQLR